MTLVQKVVSGGEGVSPLLISVTFLSSILAFLVNLSIFLVIGKTSPVSYNVLGHAWGKNSMRPESSRKFEESCIF